MNREEIEAEAYRRFPIDSTDYEMMQRSDVMWDGFVEGAEWMQEQYESNRLKHCNNITREEFDRESEFIEWFFSQGFDRQPTFSDAIEWERKQTQAEIDELSNKVSELTEALDASHVFCEGVKKHYIKKACEWAEEWFSNGEGWMRRTSFIDGIKKELTKAMKGEVK